MVLKERLTLREGGKLREEIECMTKVAAAWHYSRHFQRISLSYSLPS